MSKREQNANGAYAALLKLWFRRGKICEQKILVLFKAFVLPHLLYNSCTQAMTKALDRRIDTAHRKLLRRAIGIVYPNLISNDALYKRTSSQPISTMMRHARWRYLGHILRKRHEGHPAALATLGKLQS